MGLLRHLNQQDKELIEAGAHPVINEDYTIKKEKTINCKICGTNTSKVAAHRHDGGCVCENCWDDRLKVTE